ncbi:pilus assembly protein TadG-related protein [Sulfitobacter sp. PR48]|jgi:Flp pilus assembly protein TadG|uniref:pilus assembly protein TadG-related protein n=1 Tax=unclassified Sulfitobacter TaxID=196795 RepID=UPI0022AFAB61|nr:MULTISPECIES: pilus assembly protein TadG-related protein [unclassified Sulfitobacter]MCZ4257145.1 pilus assembly protein TadG-related protein [Sulfitobacter sp. G21635-S1]MDD9723342.1 pilus assembly protein TadG-related protein [Sulfitobacter sp. PR48]
MKRCKRENRLTAGDLLALSRHFSKSEDGSITIFACFMILIMMTICGIGVDMMRHEMERTRLQAVSDRAVLAAADLDQTLDPEAVVRDYFAKSGMAEYVSAVNVDEGLNYRTVTVDATNTIKTQFMNTLGVDDLSVPARSKAEEKVAKVEISMVLDISGSMGSNNKIQNMRNAAKVFVDTVIRDETEDLISVSVVPYSAHVNAGPEIFDRMGVQPVHNYSHCVEFPDSDFDETFLHASGSHYSHMQHFQNHDPGWNQMSETVCPRYDFERIQPLSQNASALKAQIDQLEPRANTSIFLGMKWGTALLDPSFRPINQSMASAGLTDPAFSSRPASYDDPETLKTVILMTDGQNVTTYRIPSWYYNSDSEIVHWSRYNLGWYVNRYVSYYYRQNFRTQKYSDYQGDLLLSKICGAAKDAKIVVWSIGFEVTDHGANVMRDCASSPSHFFRVEGVEIEDAFEAIARQINQLRLTQ